MKITVRFFGNAAELAGCSERLVEVEEATVRGVERALRREMPDLQASVRFAVGTEYAESETPVREGDVVSVIPPVGGG